MTTHATEPRGPITEMVLLRLRDLVREPGTLFWIFGFPLMLAVGLGLAFRNRPPDPVRVVVTGAESAWAAQVLAPPAFTTLAADRADALLQLRRGQADLLVDAATRASVAYRYDDTRPEARLARTLAADALERASGRPDVIRAHDERVVEPGSRYIDFLLPSLIGMNIMGSSMWGTGYNTAEARKKKLLKRYAATPMRRRDYLTAMWLARLLLLAFEVVALLLIGRFAFGVHIHGGIVDVLVVCLVGGGSFTGLALLLAARARSAEVVSGLMNMIMLPMYLLSGAFFSATRFPDWMQPFIQALPLTAMNDALRGIINEGASLSSQVHELAILGAWGVIPFAIAVRVFRWQ